MVSRLLPFERQFAQACAHNFSPSTAIKPRAGRASGGRGARAGSTCTPTCLTGAAASYSDQNLARRATVTLQNASSNHHGGVDVLFMDGFRPFREYRRQLAALLRHRDSRWQRGFRRRSAFLIQSPIPPRTALDFDWQAQQENENGRTHSLCSSGHPPAPRCQFFLRRLEIQPDIPCPKVHGARLGAHTDVLCAYPLVTFLDSSRPLRKPRPSSRSEIFLSFRTNFFGQYRSR